MVLLLSCSACMLGLPVLGSLHGGRPLRFFGDSTCRRYVESHKVLVSKAGRTVSGVVPHRKMKVVVIETGTTTQSVTLSLSPWDRNTSQKRSLTPSATKAKTVKNVTQRRNERGQAVEPYNHKS